MLKRQYKVTKKLGGIPKIFKKWEDWKEGDVLVGTVVGEHEDQYDKVCPIIQVVEAFFNKKSDPSLEGKNLVLNHCGVLAKAFLSKGDDGKETLKIATGTLVQITYTGTATIEKGKFKGKDAHTMTVDVVEEETEDSEIEL